MSRLRLSRFLTSFIFILTGLIAACGNTSPPDVKELINKASTNFKNDTSLHFSLVASNIPPMTYAVTRAEGDVVRPDKLHATGSVMPFAGIEVPIEVIFVDGGKYLSLAKASFLAVDVLPNLLLIFDKDKGIGGILSKFQNGSQPTSERIQGQDCWKTSGTVDSALLAPITGSDTSVSKSVKTVLWIGQDDNQIHQVQLVGQASDGDKDNTTRTFVLSKFNQSVKISKPAGF
jgi:hypothetical protein